MPLKKEEKVIAQQNRTVTIKKNMRCLFGQEFDIASASSISAVSTGGAKSACDPPVDAQHQSGSRKVGRASSDTAVHYDGWQPDGSRWSKTGGDPTRASGPCEVPTRVGSDSGITTGKGEKDGKDEKVSPQEMRAMAQAKKMSKNEKGQMSEAKQELMKSKWNDDWVETEGFWSASPPRTKREASGENHGQADHCATTTTIQTRTTTTTTQTPLGPTSNSYSLFEGTAGRAPAGDLFEEAFRPNQLYPRVVAQLGVESTGVSLSLTTSPTQDSCQRDRAGLATSITTPREHGCDNNADRETLARASDSHYSYMSQWVNPSGQRNSVTGSTIVFADAAKYVRKSIPSLGTQEPEEAVEAGEWRPRAGYVDRNELLMLES